MSDPSDPLLAVSDWSREEQLEWFFETSEERAKQHGEDDYKVWLSIAKARAEASPYGFICPHCGYDGVTDHAGRPGGNGEGFRYVEDVPEWRTVYPGGEVVVSTDPETLSKLTIGGEFGSYFEASTNERFECRNCLEEFPIPEGIEWDWL